MLASSLLFAAAVAPRLAPLSGLFEDFRSLRASIRTSFQAAQSSTDEYIVATIRGGQARLRVVAMTMGSEQPREDYASFMPSAIREAPSSFSDLPLGDVVATLNTDRGCSLRVLVGIEAMRVSYSFGRSETDPVARAGAQRLVESVARHLVGRRSYRRTRPAGSLTLWGRELPARTREGRAERWVPLGAWAAAQGATVRTNVENGTALATLGGTAILVPLGGKRIKIGSNWVDLPAPVAWWDSDWYLPVEALPSGS